ncbi:MAG: hypothetical protein NXI12_08510 [Alphaproteobacteria bacterium]|nr:hypothetical protein [Alphaproteobacteria bacterium]
MMLTALAALALQATPGGLAGTWDVALYFSADAPPSATVMVLAPGDGGVLAGRFYGSPFGAARFAERNGVVAFTAMTEDGSGPYFHSGRLTEPGRIEGQTLSMGRDFLMLWTAERREEGAQ